MDFGQTSANGLNSQQPVYAKNTSANPQKKGQNRISFNQRDSKNIPPRRVSQPKNATSKLNNAFQKANWQLAIKKTQAKTNRFYKGTEVELGVDLQHFKMYGPGIYLFFNFLKHLSVTFLMMAVCALLPSVYNYFQGNGLQNLTASTNFYFAKTSIAAYSSSTDENSTMHKLFNTIPDLIGIFSFLIFYFYWLHKSTILTEKVRMEVKLRSYTVVELMDPPSKATPANVQTFFSQFGTVKEVAPVKDYDETISLSKKIYDLEIEIKELQLKNFSQSSDDLRQQIKEKQMKIDQIYKQLVLYEDEIKEETIKYFITFATVQQKQKALKELQPYMRNSCDCCSDPTPQNYLFFGQNVLVQSCHTQPGQIIWQNQHVTWKTRWIRALVQLIFVLVLILIGFLVISLLNILAPSSSSTSVDISSYTSVTILSQTNSTIIQNWCISNAATIVTDSATGVYTLCWDYIWQYYAKSALTIGISVAVIIIKTIIRSVVVFLAKFQRYKSHTDQSKDIIQNLFFTYLCTTVLITFLLQAQIYGISFKQLIYYFIDSSYLKSNLTNLKEYTDFVSNWYVDIGYQIFLTWIIMAIHPTLTMPFAHFIGEKITYWRAKDEQVQAKMQNKLQPPEFQIQDNYANILMIVFVSLALSGGMPIIIIAAFFALSFRYIYWKYLFIRYCKIPKTFDEALDNKVVGLLPYALIIHFMISIWMYGVSDIFIYDTFSFSSYITNLDYAFIKTIGFLIERIFATWYYSAVFICVFAIFFFKVIIYNMVAKNFMDDPKESMIVPVQVQANSQGEVNQMCQSSKSICDSYKIQNNPDYAEVLSIMNKKRKFIVKVKDMSSTE